MRGGHGRIAAANRDAVADWPEWLRRLDDRAVVAGFRLTGTGRYADGSCDATWQSGEGVHRTAINVRGDGAGATGVSVANRGLGWAPVFCHVDDAAAVGALAAGLPVPEGAWGRLACHRDGRVRAVVAGRRDAPDEARSVAALSGQ